MGLCLLLHSRAHHVDPFLRLTIGGCQARGEHFGQFRPPDYDPTTIFEVSIARYTLLVGLKCEFANTLEFDSRWDSTACNALLADSLAFNLLTSDFRNTLLVEQGLRSARPVELLLVLAGHHILPVWHIAKLLLIDMHTDKLVFMLVADWSTRRPLAFCWWRDLYDGRFALIDSLLIHVLYHFVAGLIQAWLHEIEGASVWGGRIITALRVVDRWVVEVVSELFFLLADRVFNLWHHGLRVQLQLVLVDESFRGRAVACGRESKAAQIIVWVLLAADCFTLIIRRHLIRSLALNNLQVMSLWVVHRCWSQNGYTTSHLYCLLNGVPLLRDVLLLLNPPIGLQLVVFALGLELFLRARYVLGKLAVQYIGIAYALTYRIDRMTIGRFLFLLFLHAFLHLRSSSHLLQYLLLHLILLNDVVGHLARLHESLWESLWIHVD